MNVREEKIFFTVGPVRIEGLLGLRQGDRAAVISHPHPLYGGTMHNNVIEALVEDMTPLSRKLSSLAPMVLPGRLGGRVGRRRDFF